MAEPDEMACERREDQRLAALRQLDLLDTLPAEAFDRITRMAAQLFNLPVAAVSLTDQDRQWFKSRVGVEHQSIPRHKAPCAQVADQSGELVVPDMLADPFYHDSPLARSGIRFYAGAPLTTREGFTLGAMCVLGPVPRQATALEMAALRDLAAMVMAQIELQHAFGRVDPLSGLSNRHQLVEDLEDMARDARPSETRLAVMLDLCSAEQLSGALRVLGSSHVDDMVRDTARLLRAELGADSRPYHVGWTQFAFLPPAGTGLVALRTLLERLMDRLGDAINPRFRTALVAGVTPFTPGGMAPRDVLRTAHSAAEDARAASLRTGVYSSAGDAVHQRRFILLDEFSGALATPGQLRLVYQPRITLASGACAGAEALLRWQHPVLGAISPGEFIPLIEQTPMARGLTAWVLEEALRQMAAWRGQHPELHLSLNVSAANLTEADLPGRVQEALQRHGLPPGCLELEVTESAVMENAGQALALLQALADAGVQLAIDDFGTGYSSLAYLQKLPAHVVKIDQSFMRDLLDDPRRRVLIEAMISLSHDLGYRVVAEGVETAAVRDFIHAAGCDEAQGYLFARPMEAADFTAWRARHAAGAQLAA